MSMNTVTENELKFVISYFNSQKQSRYRFNTEGLNNRLERLIGIEGYSIQDLKIAIKGFVGNDIYELLDALPSKPKKEVADDEEVFTATQNSEVQIPTTQIQQSLGVLEKAMAQIFMDTKAEEISKGIMAKVETSVKNFIESEYGVIKRKVEIEIEDKKIELEDQIHEKFEEVLKFVKMEEPVFLMGPAGSGKNVICKQISEVLGLDFYFTNAVTQEHKLVGFTDAMGVYHATQFYKAFKDGGLFMLDEMDGSIPEVLIILNAAIANRYFDFPAPIGFVEAHPDFRIIAAGNTFGHGASYQYVGRNQLDGASLDRFATVEITYSENIEKICANGDMDLVRFIRDFRKATEQSGVNTITSYRAITRISKMQSQIGLKETLRTCLIKNLERDDIKMIISNNFSMNTYYKALTEMAEVL